ncbi:MAG TPA: hypothetical protein PKY12_13990, partial [Catalimonadaceae bacterium]|nr:hypothetical protein [Catalimonadaceae bacterium]
PLFAQTPIAHYRLDGNANDAGSNVLNGTIVGALSPVADRFGNPNSAMRFDGNTANRIEIADNPLLGPANITLMAWVKINSQNGLSTFIGKPLSPCINDSWHFGTENGNYSAWISNSTGCGDFVQTVSPLSVGTWRHLAYTVDVVNDVRVLYVDGVPVAQGNFTSNLQYDGNLVFLGANLENGALAFPLNGDLDEVKIFGSALSSAQIALEASNVPSIGTICGTANEDGSVTLTAPDGKLFTSVQFASYGTPEGSCGSFTLGSCHASTSQSVVEAALLGNNSGTISATNSSFGDPCVGTVKRLFVQATYGGTSAVQKPGSGNAIQFDGTDDLVSIPNGGGLNNLQSGTIEMWVKWNGTQNGLTNGVTGLITSRQSDGEFSNQILGLDGTNPATAKIIWKAYGCCSSPNVTSTVSPGTGWNHVTMTYSSGDQKMYLNGILVGTGTGTGSMGNNASKPLILGNWLGNSLNGNLDEIRIWNMVLTQSQIR